MSLLRPSIAGRLLRAGAPSALRPVPGSTRFNTYTAVGTPLTTSDNTQSSALSKEEVKKSMTRHNQPDYTAEVDQASS